ncbi:cytochrome C oxidase subunit IV family protein [Inmirania thermothiophila]|uniref:Caa(3)-type oxidase subunit IV n=1 Tax=Inmirania thermothiophila TaxID=1750597 RepID=A0A3N1XS61_9GAMM|nr:cytochrome C oxidase subunit IV family protein [Inmirania thermothiophila]ROR29490.1 caa(3)-type oxidase subunit IV [Inmirania thermothiophila]
MPGIDRCTRVWVLLSALTVASWLLAETAGGWVVPAALAIAVVKGQALVDDFMGLRRAPRRWRALVSGWLLAVSAGIGAAFLT